MNMGTWFVANDAGDIAGHDLGKLYAELLAAELNEEYPGEGWEALNSKEELYEAY